MNSVTYNINNKFGTNVEVSPCKESVKKHWDVESEIKELINSDTTIDQYKEKMDQWFSIRNDLGKNKAFKNYDEKILVYSFWSIVNAAVTGNIPLINSIKNYEFCFITHRPFGNIGNALGMTPLNILCFEIYSKQCTDLKKAYYGAKKLLEFKVNPNIYSDDFVTPLTMSALVKENLLLTSLIIEHGGLHIAEAKQIDWFGDGTAVVDCSKEVTENIQRAQDLISFRKVFFVLRKIKLDEKSSIGCLPHDLIDNISKVYEKALVLNLSPGL